MIILKSISYKNFLSTGNSPNKILLNKSRSTLVIGKNGEGKSTMLDALCFGLFGKPFRNVKKNQLINSINGKNCLVEVEFSVDSRDYKVIRGIKPNIFEIYRNDDMINQDANIKDYQKVLEQQILKLNYKTFTQVVILGSASYAPFMQLNTSQRREVIEDILDIKIFSLMNSILKEKNSSIKDELIHIEEAVNLARQKVSAQKRLIGAIEDSRNTSIEKIENKIKSTLEEIKEVEEQQSALQIELADLIEKTQDETSVKTDLKKLTSQKHKLEAKISTIEDKITFIDTKDDCPSCSQKIPHEHKTVTIAQFNEELNKTQGEMDILETCNEKLLDALNNINEYMRKMTAKNIELSAINNTISMLNKQISTLNEDMTESSTNTSNLDEEKYKLKELAEEAMEMLHDKEILNAQKGLQDIAGLLLKDTGIKTAIIKEYLPIMNKLINKYLGIMNSFVHFELDESFNEVIKSRFRDEFTYASFSEGEKTRIDLAILFTWRQIAKMKNSVNTNLLIFDEIMDSSLDATGTESFMTLLSQFDENTNVFVISHKTDALFDKFRSVVKIEKRNNFSVISNEKS